MRKIITSTKKRIDRLLCARFRVIKRYNSRLLVDNRNWIDSRIIVRKPYENQQLNSCAEIIRKHNITIFIDVGANFGLYSIVLSHEPSLTKIHAYEPVSTNYHQLCGNIFVNQLDNIITPVQKALSNKTENLTIHIDPSSSGVSRLSLEHDARDSAAYTQEEQITCTTLDSELPLSGEAIFIKIDVEGHELEALGGMVNILQNNRVCLQVEAFGETRLNEISAFFEQLGYRYDGSTDSDHRYSNC